MAHISSLETRMGVASDTVSWDEVLLSKSRDHCSSLVRRAFFTPRVFLSLKLLLVVGALAPG